MANMRLIWKSSPPLNWLKMASREEFICLYGEFDSSEDLGERHEAACGLIEDAPGIPGPVELVWEQATFYAAWTAEGKWQRFDDLWCYMMKNRGYGVPFLEKGGSVASTLLTLHSGCG